MQRTVLVTGASGAIGAAIARYFARLGDKVALGCFSSRQRADALATEIKQLGGQALVCPADVSNPAQVEAMFTAIEAAFGPVQVLVNNAGVAQQKLMLDITDADWNRMLAVHTGGTFFCSRRALPAMIQKKEGCIINISSIWGQVGASCEVHYSAAKAAVIGLTKALAKEVGPCGIRVNCVAPGVVESAMLEGFSAEELEELRRQAPLLRLGTPEDIAAAVHFLAGAGASFITGQVLSPNGGMVV
ncbi:MAG: 3-oxoacyl-ACP reductase FabG [Ruminococcaceae bacterium]|nr:3-oxoacyl-ACP reductase FabG [Oscillospiraceae bacterium]